MKTNKSIQKRVRPTKRGTLQRRPVGQNHFNAKESGERGLQKHGSEKVPAGARRAIKKRLPKA